MAKKQDLKSVLDAKPADTKGASIIEWVERIALVLLPLWEWAQGRKIEALIDEEELEEALQPLRDEIAALRTQVDQLVAAQAQPAQPQPAAPAPTPEPPFQPAPVQPRTEEKPESKDKGFLDGLLGG